MTKIELKRRYFDWLCSLIYDGQRNVDSFTRLLVFLDNIPFTYTISMDGNRFSDGLYLRHRFGSERRLSGVEVDHCLADKPCSILEMMVALAKRCEETIMDDPEYGDRTNLWFWGMIDNLGLGRMDNARFDENQARAIIDIFLRREYNYDGQGGLFTVRNPLVDMRKTEIWYQAMWYLNTIT